MIDIDYENQRTSGIKKHRFLPGATLEQIEQFEKENDVNLPEDYRDWLTKCDGGDLFLPAGMQFYGVAHKPFIEVNSGDVPEGFVIIGALCNGDPVMFHKNSQQVCFYDKNAGRINPDEIYKDFTQLIEEFEEESRAIDAQVFGLE